MATMESIAFRTWRAFVVYESTHNRNARNHQPDDDERTSDAHWLFLKALRSYNPAKGTFRVWLQYTMRKGFLESFEKRANRHRILNRVADYDVSERPDSSEDRLQRFLFDLSDDAASVVRLALQPPEETVYTVGLRRRLIRGLIDKGWTGSRILRAFREIKQAIREEPEADRRRRALQNSRCRKRSSLFVVEE